MIKRMDLFMPPKSQYGVLHHFTRKMAEALSRQNIFCRVLEAEYNNPRPFLEKIFNDSPDCTLSFNGLLPDKEDRFFCDLIRIPHVACLVDSPNQFFPLAKSPYTIITCPDRFACDFFRGLNAQNVLFMPHGVEKELAPDPKEERTYDVVMLSSCIDYEKIRESWKTLFPDAVCKLMDEAAEITLSDQDTPYVQAFVKAVDHAVGKSNGLDPSKIDFFLVFDQLEMYIRGKDRVELVKGVKDAKVDIFSSGNTGLWKKYLGKAHSNAIIHDAVPFEQALDVMKKSKIVLNSCPWIKNGGHERIFASIACGALVITNENIYMREHFKDRQNILFYQHGKWTDVNQKVNEYLADKSKREKVAAKGREIVMRDHTWDQRAKILVEQLNPILKNIRA
jgi:spore maturation protein CgeB